ncbi:MAG: PEP-CTERM sorting domain-containing protein [Planctomycetota bacterium]
MKSSFVGHSSRRLVAGSLAMAAFLLLAPSATQAAVVLGSFEGDLSSPYAAEWTVPGNVSTAYVGYGATEGANGIEITKGGGWGNMLVLNGGNPLAQDLASHDVLSLDVSVPAGLNGDGGSWAQAIVVLQGDGMGYTQVQDSSGVSVDGSIVTITADLSSITLTSSSTWSQLILINQGADDGGGPIEMVIDNVRLSNVAAVPEPSSLAVLAAATGLAAIRRRRS